MSDKGGDEESRFRIQDEDDGDYKDNDENDDDEDLHLVWVMRTVALLAFSCREISAVVPVRLMMMMMVMMNMVMMMMMMMMMMITWSCIRWVHRGNGKPRVKGAL